MAMILKLFPSIVLIGSLLSCNDPKIEFKKPDIYWGECTAEINYEVWYACPFGNLKVENGTTFLGIIGDVFNESGIRIESISIVNMPTVVGTYKLGEWRNGDDPYMLFVYQHYDLALADYLVEEDKDAKGFVSLTEYDTVSNEVKGIFECTLYLYQNPGKPDAPDSLVFTNGYFHTRIID